jgi:arabinogalactan oligomer/maltooligosaccharide transport system substrate-binding protein
MPRIPNTEEDRMRSLRRLAVLLAVLALVAAACSSDGDSDTTTTAADGGTATTAAAGGETTTTAAAAATTTTGAEDGGEAMEPADLVLWHTFNETETPTLDGLVTACAAETGHNVTVELVPFAEAQNKFKTAAQAGEAPDILRAEIAWVAEFADLGYLADVTDLVSDEDMADYLAAPLAYDQYAGGLWGIPQVTDAPALYYNKALLEENGITLPTTMEELSAAGVAFGDATGTPGIGSQMNGYWTQIFIWANGGDLLSADGTEILINSPESVGGLEAYVAMASDGAMNDDLDFANQYGNVQEAFKAGEIAFNINGPWQSGDLLSGDAFVDAPDNLGIAPTPPGPGGEGAPVGGHSWVISADALDAGNREASYEVLECLNSTDAQATFALENNLLPTRTSAYAVAEVAANPIIAAFGDVMAVAHARPVIPQGGAIYADFDPNVQAAFAGDMTAQEALDNVAAAWEALGLGS